MRNMDDTGKDKGKTLDHASRTTHHGSRLTGWKANLLVLFLGLLPFILLEAVLWIIGYESHAYYENTSVHVQAYHEVDGMMVVTPQRRRQIKTKPFSAVKSTGTIRVMTVGDSVTAGFMSLPGKNVFAFETNCYPVILEALLSKRYPNRKIEVINCGACGYGTYRLKDLLIEVLHYEPDVVTIHCGSSEILEARHFKNWEGVRAALASKGILHWKTLALARDLFRRAKSMKTKPGSEILSADGMTPSLPWMKQDLVRSINERKAILDHSARNLKMMIKACKEAGIPVIVCNSPSNLRVHSFAGDIAGNQRFSDLYRTAKEGIKERDFSRVVSLLEPELEEFRDDYTYGSHLYFLAGEAYSGMGMYEKAYDAYVKAVDLDPEVIRATSKFNDMLARVAAAEGVPLVDLVTEFRKAMPDGIPDNRLFWDNCHFRIPAHEIAARAISVAIGQTTGTALDTRH